MVLNENLTSFRFASVFGAATFHGHLLQGMYLLPLGGLDEPGIQLN